MCRYKRAIRSVAMFTQKVNVLNPDKAYVFKMLNPTNSGQLGILGSSQLRLLKASAYRRYAGGPSGRQWPRGEQLQNLFDERACPNYSIAAMIARPMPFSGNCWSILVAEQGDKQRRLIGGFHLRDDHVQPPKEIIRQPNVVFEQQYPFRVLFQSERQDDGKILLNPYFPGMPRPIVQKPLPVIQVLHGIQFQFLPQPPIAAIGACAQRLSVFETCPA